MDILCNKNKEVVKKDYNYYRITSDNYLEFLELDHLHKEVIWNEITYIPNDMERSRIIREIKREDNTVLFSEWLPMHFTVNGITYGLFHADNRWLLAVNNKPNHYLKLVTDGSLYDALCTIKYSL